MTGIKVRGAILLAFPELTEVFETGIGLSLMFRESQILTRALLRLAKLDIPCMGMHDGLMVQRSKATTLRSLKEMEDGARHLHVSRPA